MRSKLVALFNLALIGVLVLAGAELGARADDWTFEKVPFWSAPRLEDLWTETAGVRHGRPHASFQKKIYNNLGFEGPEITGPPAPGCVRVFFLGGSETFGPTQVAGGDYPHRVRELLNHGRCVQVLNGSIPGMTVAAMIRYWNEYAHQLQPDLVFVYPSTHFYLSDIEPRVAPASSAGMTAVANHADTAPRISTDQSRFLGRLRDAVELPQVIQVRRQQAWLAAQVNDKPADWLFMAPPIDRVALFVSHVDELTRAISASGARVVLATHAISAARHARPEDHENLFAMRTFTPRATETTLAEFPYLANAALREYAGREGISLVDVAQVLAGDRDCFIDLVHLSPGGTEKMAVTVTASLEQLIAPGEANNAVQ